MERIKRNGYGWRYCLDGSTVRNYVLLNASPQKKEQKRLQAMLMTWRLATALLLPAAFMELSLI